MLLCGLVDGGKCGKGVWMGDMEKERRLTKYFTFSPNLIQTQTVQCTNPKHIKQWQLGVSLTGEAGSPGRQDCCCRKAQEGPLLQERQETGQNGGNHPTSVQLKWRNCSMQPCWSEGRPSFWGQMHRSHEHTWEVKKSHQVPLTSSQFWTNSSSGIFVFWENYQNPIVGEPRKSNKISKLQNICNAEQIISRGEYPLAVRRQNMRAEKRDVASIPQYLGHQAASQDFTWGGFGPISWTNWKSNGK